MHIQPKTLASGKTRYYLRYWKEGKNKFVPSHLYPEFKTKKQAKDWIKNHAAKVGAKLQIEKHTEAMQRVEWRKKFHNFEEFLEIYIKWQKKQAPNSWKNNLFYLEQYVFRYFLNMRGMNNLNLWYTEFQLFKDWLEEEARITRGRATKILTDEKGKPKKMNSKNELISYSTKNHCIRTLNNFIKCMKKYNKIEPTYALRCDCFKQSLVNQNARTYKDVIDEEQYNQLTKKLTMSKEFFMVLYHTGMRFNELYSLSINDLYEGQEALEPFVIETIEEKLDGKIYGYISLKSQIASKNVRTRSNMGHVERKPLKGRDTEDDKDGRLVPIYDPEVWDILVENYNRASEEFEKKAYKSRRKQDYFLFDISPSEIRKEFRKFCDKGFHACRHSKITFTVGKTQSVMFCRLTCGHRGESYENYLHTYEMWVKKANEQPQKNRFKKVGQRKLKKVG